MGWFETVAHLREQRRWRPRRFGVFQWTMPLAAGSSVGLVATIPSGGGALDSNQRARTQVGKQMEDSWDERQEVLNAVRLSYEDDHSDCVPGDVLLELRLIEEEPPRISHPFNTLTEEDRENQVVHSDRVHICHTHVAC